MVVSIGSRIDIDDCGISPYTVEIRDSARLSRGFDGERALMPDLLPGCDLAEFSAVLHIGSGGFTDREGFGRGRRARICFVRGWGWCASLSRNVEPGSRAAMNQLTSFVRRNSC